MALLFVIVGAILAIAAVNGREGDLFQAIGEDVPPVAEQIAAILLIGLLGFIPNMRTPSRALMALVILVILLDEQGAWQNFSQTAAQFQAGQLRGIPAPQALSPSAAIPVVSNQPVSPQPQPGGSSGVSAGGILSTLGHLFGF
jgi:hypothetical protein